MVAKRETELERMIAARERTLGRKLNPLEEVKMRDAYKKGASYRASDARRSRENRERTANDQIGMVARSERVTPYALGKEYIAGQSSIHDVEKYLSRFVPGHTKDRVREEIMRGVEAGQEEGIAKASRVQPIQTDMGLVGLKKAKRQKGDVEGKLAKNPHHGEPGYYGRPKVMESPQSTATRVSKLARTHAERKQRLLDLYEIDARSMKSGRTVVERDVRGYKPMKRERGEIYQTHKRTPYKMTTTNKTRGHRVK